MYNAVHFESFRQQEVEVHLHCCASKLGHYTGYEPAIFPKLVPLQLDVVPGYDAPHDVHSVALAVHSVAPWVGPCQPCSCLCSTTDTLQELRC